MTPARIPCATHPLKGWHVSPKRTSVRRFGAAATAVIGLTACALSATTANASTSQHSSSATDPIVAYFQTHHGAMPTVAQQAHIRSFLAAHPDAATTAATTSAATSANTLAFGGGTNGIGVMSGAKTKVYLVFYGSQWGTQSTDASGDAKFTGDPSGTASAAQQMFKGIGTNNETWSADLTQWCDGAGVSVGATSCPSTLPASQFVPYQSGGVLAGVWNDNSAAEPSQPNGNALAQEATTAAAHFGNTTAASNRNAYYVILSAHGTDPDNYEAPYPQGYCAWHTFTADSSLSGGAASTPYGNIAFSNQPYNTDMGATCGVGFVNGTSSGALDGYTMTLGHEWHEMMSDVDPVSGWANPGTTGGTKGYENSDECAWIQPGQTGGAANVSFGSFGTFAEQASWSNDTNACAISHQILNHGGGQGDTVTVTNPGNQTGTVGTAASLQIKASDSAAGQTLAYSATGLPSGLSINSASGLISGTPTGAGNSNATVTATDGTGASGSTAFSWTVTASGGGGGCTAAQLIANGGFENGSAPWTGTTGAIVPSSYGEPAHSGSYLAWLDGYGYAATDTLAQTVSIPAGCKSATFSFWRHIDTAEYTTTKADDTLAVQVLNPSGTVLATLHDFSNLDADNQYDQETFSLNQFIGQKVTLKFTGTETDADFGTTDFVLDDVTLNVN